MNKSKYPLVSIGLPVRNGEKTLALAIDNICSQTYPNIEIIISDNCSNDATLDIIKYFALRDKRITYFAQNEFITALQNFQFVLEKSNGDFFAWASHDDLRSDNWIEILVEELSLHPNSCLAGSDYALINSHDTLSAKYQDEYSNFFGPKTDSIFVSFRERAHVIHTYCLFRSHLLKKYSFRDIDYFGDLALVAFLSFIGDFSYRKGAVFYYYYPVTKSSEQHALEVSGKKLRPFPGLRISWYTSRVLAEAAVINGQNRNAFIFLPFALWLFHKRVVYLLAPAFVRYAWRYAKQLRLAKPGLSRSILCK